MADRRLVDDLNRVVTHPPKPPERLAPAGSPGALPGRGTGKPGDGNGGSGIASPLTEPDYAARQYHPDLILTSSDGVFTIEVQPLAVLVLRDALGLPVRIQYAAPPPPAPPP